MVIVQSHHHEPGILEDAAKPAAVCGVHRRGDEGVIDLIDKVQIPAGECIVKQDEMGDCMYVLVEGTARVVHRRDGKEIELAVLKKGISSANWHWWIRGRVRRTWRR